VAIDGRGASGPCDRDVEGLVPQAREQSEPRSRPAPQGIALRNAE